MSNQFFQHRFGAFHRKFLLRRRIAQPFRAVIAAPPTYDRRSRSGSLPKLAGMRCASSLMIRFMVFRRQARFRGRRYLYVPD
jgi:hypothetical protein